jgi:hypothetical protein
VTLANKGTFVDPAVSVGKFSAEVSQWDAVAAEHAKRGIFVCEARFPKIYAVFTAPQLQPALVLFGVELDFTNYDLWPPSLTLINPFTRSPEKPAVHFLRPRPNAKVGENPFESALAEHAGAQPFLCMKGIREYHMHPAHTGDPWLQYRGTEIGTLGFILDKVHEFGVSRIQKIQWTINPQIAGVEMRLN